MRFIKMADVGEGKYCDEQQLALGERLREAACIGDLDTVKFLVENGHVMDVNSKNSVNGWLVWGLGAREWDWEVDLGIASMRLTGCSE